VGTDDLYGGSGIDELRDGDGVNGDCERVTIT
jgi:hypothetical protein